MLCSNDPHTEDLDFCAVNVNVSSEESQVGVWHVVVPTEENLKKVPLFFACLHSIQWWSLLQSNGIAVDRSTRREKFVPSDAMLNEMGIEYKKV